ncbi:hypothetical protein G6F70_008703 [Rhizopus microsporus]|nr:hypothetical protein G6F71_008671 [Rhizopus microsporus]KAG1194824.1 hypothetical protein G6F70_008703 [Rhizopus microsporus]KAG1206643.1 hypothetical protein G6F69_008675 [Rhizopus microsporus]KAG1227113.1 hypothetical protein G6F67_008645 [Rhizopus microsporus]KAG1258904.1 hypothetical protein G6F68_008485 [Rhizopus microsporus]
MVHLLFQGNCCILESCEEEEGYRSKPTISAATPTKKKTTKFSSSEPGRTVSGELPSSFADGTPSREAMLKAIEEKRLQASSSVTVLMSA